MQVTSRPTGLPAAGTDPRHRAVGSAGQSWRRRSLRSKRRPGRRGRPPQLRSRADGASRERGGKGHGGATEPRAIIPGRIVAVAVAPGDNVVAGQQLLVIEAMKMQNELRAPRAGVIARVIVGPGQTVDLGDLLVEIG